MFTCPKCGKLGKPDTVTRRNSKGEIKWKESYCLHFLEEKNSSGYPKTKRCMIGRLQTAESLGLDFLKE